MKNSSYTTSNNIKFTSQTISEICDRVDKGHDWQRIINDEIWERVNYNDDIAHEVYNYCEDLVQENNLVS